MHRKQSLLVLTEAGPSIGFGHIVRCSSIAHEFRAALWTVAGLVFTEGKSVDLPEGFESYDWRNNFEFLPAMKSADIVLVDSYVIPNSSVKIILEVSKRPVFIDDVIRRHYDRGCVLDWTIRAETNAFLPRNEHVSYFLGPTYCCLREEFTAPARVRSELESIMITFGGSDFRSLTRPVVQMLCEQWPGLKKRVVVGPGADDRFLDQREWPMCDFFFNCSASKMRDIMDASSIAVCTGGQTLYEMAARGLPPVVIGILDEQMEDINGFVAEGFATYVGPWDDKRLSLKLKDAVCSMMNSSLVTSLSAVGMSLVDGAGSKRLVAALGIRK